jgi:uncharacterized damage-inducible protein DinB
MTADGISFEELLRYNELETTKWKDWFAAHPEAFNHPCDIAKAGTVGALMNHMFVAELFFATQLLGLPARDWQSIHPESMDEVFALHEEAYAKFAEFLAKGPEAADWATVQDLSQHGRAYFSMRGTSSPATGYPFFRTTRSTIALAPSTVCTSSANCCSTGGR